MQEKGVGGGQSGGGMGRNIDQGLNLSAFSEIEKQEIIRNLNPESILLNI